MIDIDKAWHVLHFLLTGTSSEGDFPQGFLLTAGNPVGDVDVGYGPVRSFTVREVLILRDYLVSVDKEVLRERFLPSTFSENEIYPNVWDRSDQDDEWPYFEGAFEETVLFIRETADKGMALLIYLN